MNFNNTTHSPHLGVKETTGRATSVCAVLAAHNRRALTMQLLRSLKLVADSDQTIELSVVLTDDGSSDGTADAAVAAFPSTHVIRGDGSLFYAGGMALAHAAAAQKQPDHILWLNDDVVLDDDALHRALNASAHADVVVGAVRSATGDTTYSGMRQVKGRYGRLVGAFAELEPSGAIQRIDTFQGNFVLISKKAYQQVGSVDEKYAHGFSDVDYGLRARSLGLRLILLGGSVGVCERNPIGNTWEDRDLPIRQRMRLLANRKTFPPRSQWRFSSRHGRQFAPLWFMSTYASAVKRMMRP